MKKLFLTMFCLGLAAPLFADGTNQLYWMRSRVLKPVRWGKLTGTQWKKQELDFDPDVYAQAIKDAMAGGATLLTQEQAQQTLEAFKKEFTAKQQQKKMELAVKDKADGDAFLATNKMTPGVQLLSVSLPNGKTSELQYIPLTTGTGAIPQANDKVSC